MKTYNFVAEKTPEGVEINFFKSVPCIESTAQNTLGFFPTCEYFFKTLPSSFGRE